MGLYLVSTRHGGEPVEVDAPNWLVALGVGLDQLGEVTSIDRLACEVLANGKVIARDVRTGTGFVVQIAVPTPETVPVAADVEVSDAEDTLIAALPEPPEEEGEPPIATFADDEDDETFSMPADDEELDELLETSQQAADVAWEAEAPFFAVDTEPRTDAGTHSESGVRWEPVALPAPEATTVPEDSLPALPDDDDDDSESLWTFPFSEDEAAPESGEDAALQAVLETISAAVTVDGAWQTALEGAHTLIQCESGAALRQEWDGTLRFIGARGPQAHKVLGERVPSGLGIVGFCVQRRVSLLIRDPKRDPRFFANMDRRTGYHTASVLAVPVLYESTTFGCLELLNAPRGFSRENLERLVSIADGLAEQLLVTV